MGIATQLTFMRIVLIPFLVMAFYWQSPWSYLLCALIYSAAAISDWLDGYLARKLQEESPFGAFLDPVADKLIVIVALVLLVERHQDIFITIPVMLIITREVIVTSLRQWMAQLLMEDKVSVSRLGKWKTGFQIAAIIVMLLFNIQFYPIMHNIGVILLYIATSLALWSMIKYLRQASIPIK